MTTPGTSSGGSGRFRRLSGGKLIFSPPEPKNLSSGEFREEINFCQSPEHKNWCSWEGGLNFDPSLNSSLNKIVQGKLFLWSPRTNFYCVLEEMNFPLPQTKFLDVSLLSRGKQLRKLLTCPTKQGDIWALQKSV